MEAMRKELLFQQYIIKLIQEIETLKETYNEHKIKIDFSDKNIPYTIMTMSVLKVKIRDLEAQFEGLFSVE